MSLGYVLFTWEIKNLKIVEGEAAINGIGALNNATVAAEGAFTANLTDAVVTYVNGNNAFIEDATGGIQLYMKDHGLTAGQKINGKVTGKTKLYNSYAEATAWDVSEATVEDGAELALYAQIKNAIDVPEGKGTLIGFPTRYNANLQIGVWDSAHFTAE